MCVDLAIHHRLGEARFVAFVMTVAAITDQVDHKILAEFLPIGESSARRLKTSERIIRVNMDDRHFESLRQIAGMQTAARFGICGGEAQLIVGDDVQTATGGIPGYM